MRAPSPHHEPFNERAAPGARLARALEDVEREGPRGCAAPASDAALSRHVHVRALGDGLREDGDDRPVEEAEPAAVEGLDRLERVDPRAVEDLVRVDVAYARNEGLVEEDRLHRSAAAARALLEHGGRELLLEGLGADRALELVARRVVHDIEPAEAARVLEVEVERAEVEREPRPPRAGLARRLDPELPGELQVEDERAPAAQVDEDELAAPADRADGPLEGPGRRAPARAPVVNRRAPDLRAEDATREVADDVVDFGELGHGVVGPVC